jgi:DNA invertase Pin-like site-specific DNA recombinase
VLCGFQRLRTFCARSGTGGNAARDEQPIDTSTAAGKCLLDTLGVFAEFEINLRRERQLEGIAKAKAQASTRAGPPSIELASAHFEAAQRPCLLWTAEGLPF